MASQLRSSFGKRGVDHGLFTMKVDIEDTAYLSKYFDVAEFNPVFTAGKNPISFNGTSLLAQDTEIKVQCVDSNGNSLYLDYPKSETQYADVAKFVVSIHVYNEAYNGAGKIALVGTTAKGEIVRWIANISIDKTLQNVSKTRFLGTPTIEARSLLYPVIANDKASQLTYVIPFTGSCYTNAITPQKDTIKSYINPKKTDIDYRITFNSKNAKAEGPQTFPTCSFNTQMEGQTITVRPVTIQQPFSYRDYNVYVSASFKIKKVIDADTLQVTEPFFFTVGKNQVVSNINLGYFTSSYKWVAYNTQSDIYNKYTDSGGVTTYQKESYAEILYRNLTTFSGFIARHKLYRKSMIYPGDFSLIADEPLGTRDLLVDPVTANKSYNLIGTFYNQWHINKYWFTSSKELQLSHSVTPRINSMRVGRASASYDKIDGTKYVIVKTDSVDTVPNDATYWPYQANEFNELQGLAYNSNFIDLKSGSLYVLSMLLAAEKEKFDQTSKIQFFFTSSIPEITREKNYIPPFGLKIGEIVVTGSTDIKVFSDKQYLYFTPREDYYGTLVIVPYRCTPTFSELSLGVYGDYGFSPDSMTTKVAFPVNVGNEAWQLKAELFDINSTLVYSNLSTIQTFDYSGSSKVVIIGGGIDPDDLTVVNTNVSIKQGLYVQGLGAAPPNKRLVGWVVPTHAPPTSTDGQLVYTDILGVGLEPTNKLGTVTTKDYISVVTTAGGERALAVHYSGSISQGRKVYINSAGVKTTYS